VVACPKCSHLLEAFDEYKERLGEVRQQNFFNGAILFEKMPEFVYDWEDERGCITPG
jgi:hypothetical protein